MSWTVKHYESVTSTQDMAREHLTEKLIIQAKTQSAGKGRHGRKWVSQEGNLFFSFIIKPNSSPDLYGQIALKVGLALGRAIQGSGQKSVTLKWPNDVLVEGRKCAGILIEVEEGALIIGIGINTKHAPEGAHALSVQDNNQFRDVFFQYFDVIYSADFMDIKPDWLAMAHKRGEKINVKVGNNKRSGYFEGIDDKGNLMIEGQTISAGEVIL